MPRTAPLLFSLLLAGLLAACSDAATEPTGAQVGMAVSVSIQVPGPDSLVLPGDTLRLVATARNDRNEVVSLPANTFSWTTLTPDIVTIAAGRLIAQSAGTARIAVQAVGASDTAEFTVSASEVIVRAHDIEAGRRYGTGDVITLTGSGLQQVKAADILTGPGEAPVVLHADRTTLRIELPTVNVAGCAGSARTTLEIAAAGFSVPVLRQRAGERVLAPGDVVTLSAAEAACLRLPPTSGAEGARYFLAFQDTSLMNAARTRVEPYLPSTQWQGSVADRSAPAGAASPTLAAARLETSEPAPDVVLPNSPGGMAMMADGIADWTDAAPWEAGEVMFAKLYRDTATVVVQRVYDGYFAVMTTLRDTARFRAIEARLDSAMTFLRTEFLPEMTSILPEGRPRFNGKVDQVAIVIYLDQDGKGNCGGFGFWGRTEIGCSTTTSARALMDVLAHELTHVWHIEHVMKSGGGVMSRWNTEGLASLWQGEMLRRWTGAPIDAELPYDDDHPLFALALFLHGPFFTSGYYAVAAVALDLAWGLGQERGLPHGAALREISRGMRNGWYGCDQLGRCGAEGLAEVMPPLLGRAWHPAEFLTDALLATVADDAPLRPRYQRPMFERASYQGSGYSKWQPGPGRPELSLHAGSGASGKIEIPSGAGGTIELIDAVGGTFTLGTESVPAFWKLMRVR